MSRILLTFAVLAMLLGPVAVSWADSSPAGSGAAGVLPPAPAPKPAAPAPAPIVPATVAQPSASAPHDVADLATKISYITGGTVYLESGREDGLHEGDTLSVKRGDAEIGRLKVTFLSSHRAACDTFKVATELHVGDAIKFVAHDHTLAQAPVASSGQKMVMLTSTSPAVPMAKHAKHEVSPLHGRVGARFLSVQDKGSGGNGGFSQPALDVLLNGSNMSGVPIDLSLDARTRRTTTTIAGGGLTSDASTRIYRASLSLHDRLSKFRMTIGRQTSPTLASVSIFDGVLAEYGGNRYSAGLFSGTQPDPVQDNISSSIFEHGAYVEMHQRPMAMRHWSLALGGVTSTQDGQVNRDFLFTQAYYQTPNFSTSINQEVDVNRGWKRAAGEQPLTPTSTFAMARLQLSKPLSLNIGYDNRRNVRLYRDYVSPATEFDDLYRSGGWVGASLEGGPHMRLDGDFRQRGGSPADRSTAWSSGAQFMRMGFWNLTMRGRYSEYNSTTLISRLTSFGASVDPIGYMHLEGSGGTRSSINSGFTSASENVVWYSADLDLTLARRWYVNANLEHDKGTVSDITQEYVGLSWRF
ncbi:MAG: hypothetical protein ACRENS_00385 [Candidatus Eiseniibacteriota bacterium]